MGNMLLYGKIYKHPIQSIVLSDFHYLILSPNSDTISYPHKTALFFAMLNKRGIIFRMSKSKKPTLILSFPRSQWKI